MKLARSIKHLPDIAPIRHDGIMRWSNGAVWIPEPSPTRTTGLLGRATRADWRSHALAAAAQVRALTRHSENLQLKLDATVTKSRDDQPPQPGDH